MIAVLVLGTAGTVMARPGFSLALRIPGCCNSADPAFGASVASSPRGILVGIPGQEVGAAALFDATSGALRGVLHSPVPSHDFGRTVAADGSVLAISAPDTRVIRFFDADSLAAIGTIDDPNPLVPPDQHAIDEFGAALAISGNRVVVGAPFDDSDGEDAGAAYLFDRSGGAPVRLHSGAPFPGARFGTSVALAADDVIVSESAEGAPDHTGSVYGFSARTGELEWTIAAPPSVAHRLFGFAVAADGAYLVVGAPCRDGDPQSGAAVVYRRATGTLLRTFTAPSPETCDFFGSAVAAGGGLVVVGARLAGTPDTGAVHIFSAATGALRASFADGEPEADLGWSVATQGERVIVGASGEDGEVRVYAHPGD
jgi:hypothetical protein